MVLECGEKCYLQLYNVFLERKQRIYVDNKGNSISIINDVGDAMEAFAYMMSIFNPIIKKMMIYGKIVFVTYNLLK